MMSLPNSVLRVVVAGFVVCLFAVAQEEVLAQKAEVADAKQLKSRTFATRLKARNYMAQQDKKGIKTQLKEKKRQYNRYIISIKGYRQWSQALKQAQALEKMGFKGSKVKKDSLGRTFSVEVVKLLNKKKAGSTYNQLRGMGLKNVKVEKDFVEYSVFVVDSYRPKIDRPSPSPSKIAKQDAQPVQKKQSYDQQPVVAKKTSQAKKQPVVSPVSKKKKPDTLKQQAIKKTETQAIQLAVDEQPASVEEDEIILISEDQDSLGEGDEIILLGEDPASQDDEIMIVMSDVSDITYEIDMQESMQEKSVSWSVDKIIFEEQLFTRSDSDVSHAEYAHLSAYLDWRLSSEWNIQIAGRVDGYSQHGDRREDFSEIDVDYGDTFIRYRDDKMRLTLGTQTIRWGRLDTAAPTDNLVTFDLSRGVLPDWDEFYRSSPALRGEFYLNKGKLDVVYLAKFRETELPDKYSVWHPINRRRGEMLGAWPNAFLKPIIQQAKIDDDIDGDGGGGVRFSSTQEGIDYALTVQRVRLSTPSYVMNEAFRQELMINPALALAEFQSKPYIFREHHPRNWIVGGDMAFNWDVYTLRMEAAWFSDLPANTQRGDYKTYDGLKWGAGIEFYPGDGDARVNLQLSGSHIDEKEKIIDRDNIVSLGGETEALFANNRWKFTSKFNIGLDKKDVYLSPEVSFLGWEPWEVYMAFHYLEGHEQTVGGFYKENSMVTLGLRGKY